MPNRVIIVGSDINVPVATQPTEVTSVRLVAAGQVAAGPHKLCWITMNPSAGNSVFELTDAIAALGVVIYDHFHTSRDAHHININPPMPFTTGIYLETFTNMTSVIFGYV